MLNGKMILQIPSNGDGGAGCFYVNLQVQIGVCYAEFEISDRVIEYECLTMRCGEPGHRALVAIQASRAPAR